MMETRFLSRIASRELRKLLVSVAEHPVHRGYQFPQGATLPATLFYMEQSAWDIGGHNIPAEHLTAGSYRFVVRTDDASTSDIEIAKEAERLLGAVAGQVIDTEDGFQVTFTALGETPITSTYDGAQEYQRLGAIYQVYVTQG